ncbi:MAG: type II toxin-antitoxin system RatA family toxin [Gammaproteobacteria bacterium]|nr:type II toxin-antitoxin system RatA family toxin [Gammaproteobacteria bacterium]
MTTIRRSALLPYSAAEMYSLVDDIESYPKFLPWCVSATVFSRNDDEVRASLELARSGIRKSFTTCNRIQKNKMIEIRLVEGPFHHLQGFWRFEPLEASACKISLDMEFEFSGRLLSMTIGPVFSQIAESLVESFGKRAVEIFGKR